MWRAFLLSARHPWLVIAVYVVATILAAVGATRVEAEDDVFVFLPQEDPDVQAFQEVSDRFGALRVALVGVAVDGEGDVLEEEVVRKVQAATTGFEQIRGVTRVLSLTNTADVVSGPQGALVELLVPGPPGDEAAHQALRDRVMARDLVVGNLISADARATTLIVYFKDGSSTTQIVEDIREVAGNQLGGLRTYFGGGPFAADSIYGETRADVQRLSPVAGLVLVLVIFLSFRDMVGVALTFWTVAFGTLLTLGTMGFLEEKYSALTSTLPVLLLATGSSYAVHVLGRYYLEREKHPPPVALMRTAKIVSRPVGIAAWTTIAAFLAFVVMDVRPMRTFGAEVALGTLACWIMAITLIPAVLTVRPRAPQREQLVPFGGALLAGWRFAERRWKWFLAALGVLVVVSALPLPDVRARMEPSAFFVEGSDAWNSHRFFEQEFGGARFVQVEARGDFTDPVTIRALARLADATRAIPGVTLVSSPVEPMALTMGVLGGTERLPRTSRQAGQTLLFLDGEAGFGALLRPDHEHALISGRIKGDAAPVVEALESWVDANLSASPEPPSVEGVVRHVADIGRSAGADPDPDALREVVAAVALPEPTDPGWRAAQASRVAAFLASEDAEELDDAQREIIQAAATSGGNLEKAWMDAMGNEDDAGFFHDMLKRSMGEAREAHALESGATRVRNAMGLEPGNPRVDRALRMALDDLLGEPLEGAGTGLEVTVTGEPILDRALSKSVRRNQVRTMAVGLVIVSILLVILFRSVALSAICIAPAFLTAVVLGGLMGAMEVEIDLSTAMVGAILTDTASDFGMHYIWYLQRRPVDEVIRNVGPIMIVSTMLVAAGFFVFSLGSSPVLKLFGNLSGATCVLSALFAVILVPTAWTAMGKLTERYRVDESKDGQ